MSDNEQITEIKENLDQTQMARNAFYKRAVQQREMLEHQKKQNQTNKSLFPDAQPAF